jgi:hypothetical protein
MSKVVTDPVRCQCVKSCQINPGEWMVIIGAAGGMG